MVKNQLVLEKLQNLEAAFKDFDSSKRLEVFQALESVFEAEPGNVRKAFIDNKETWKDIFKTDIADADWVDEDAFLISEGKGDSALQKANSFKGLQNAAALAYASLIIHDFDPENLNDLEKLNDLATAENKEVLNRLNPNIKNVLTKGNFKALQQDANHLLLKALQKKLDDLVLEVDDEVYAILIKFYNTEDLTVLDDFLNEFPKQWINQQRDQVLDLFKQNALDALTKRLSKSKDKAEILNVLKATKPEDIDDRKWLSQDDITKLKSTAREAFIPMMEEDIKNLLQDARAPKKQLEALRRATLPPMEFDHFVKHLKAAGIENTELLEKDNMPRLISPVMEKAFALQLDLLSIYGASAHPQLIESFVLLEPEKQQELMQDFANNVYRLIHSNEKEELQVILGKDAQVIDIINENKNISQFHKIHNAEVAKILANSAMDLEPQQVEDINQQLHDYLQPDTEFSEIISAIVNLFPAENRTKLLDKFGMQEREDKILQAKADAGSQGTIKRINDQSGYNERLIKSRGDDALALALIEQLIPLEKNAQLEKKDTQKFIDVFRKQSTYRKFLKNVSAAAPKITSPLEEYFTPEEFIRLKRIHLEYLDESKQEIEAKKILDAMNDEFNALAMTDDDTRATFRKILGTKFEKWLNPAFMAKAREDATKLKNPFEELAKNCSIVIRLLEEQKAVLEGLPQGPQTFNEKIQKRLARIIRDLNDYKKVQDRLLGQGQDGKKGILTLIHEAEKGGVAIKGYFSESTHFTVTVTSIDEDASSDKEKLAQAKGTTPQVENPTLIHGPDDNLFAGDKIQDKKIRVFNFKHGREEGQFIEKFGPSNPSWVTVKDKPSTPLVKLEATTFPKNSDPKAMLHFSMVMASQMLSCLDGPPGKKQPIILRGGTPEQQRYLWTALMILGRDGPHMKFGAEAIKVASFSFDPKKEQGRIARFASGSLYNQLSSKQAEISEHVNYFRGLCEQKFGHESDIKKTTTALTQLHRSKLQKLQLDKAPEEPRGPKQ